jgi:hypothetical protein
MTHDRQRRWQLERIARSCCTICGRRRLHTTTRCLTLADRLKQRYRSRVRSGLCGAWALSQFG